jgi:SAM-dependent methyltransferase
MAKKSRMQKPINELTAYGIEGHCLRWFADPISPELLDYLDLLSSRDGAEILPDGVAENQGRPLLYFVNESRLLHSSTESETRLGDLRRSLACRGERAYLARIRPGELLVVPISLAGKEPPWKQYRAGNPEAKTFFSRLVLGQYDGKGDRTHAGHVFDEMFRLLKHAAERLAEKLDRDDVLSMVGRALFFRFLRERRVITEHDRKIIAPRATDLRSCFDDAENTAATSAWLDRTFNGDFLPLTGNGNLTFFKGLASKTQHGVFNHLSAIVRGDEPAGAEDYQRKLDWGDFDFAHVPVGLLSQVYEAFCWKWDPQHSKKTSVHYTPRNIAATLVEEAFDGLPYDQNFRVLDPACGAGIFLVLAFRRLYRERWKSDGERPDTKTIRQILERQLAGFDISDSALKLAALSLYLTAIELDPNPIPPEKLRFKALRDSVLFNFRREGIDPPDRPAIGSLGSHVGDRFDGQFDLVLSNPPWTSLDEKEKALAEELNNVSKEILQRRNKISRSESYENPDSVPDLPFVWKSTEWCKPGGRIAMALHARLLLKQEEIPTRARETLLQSIDVTGIINGSNLADTNVWLGMNQPFLLLFARNHEPKPGHVLHFIALHHDRELNRRGEVHVDSKSSQPVELATTMEEPWIWKALAVGTNLDTEIIRRVKAKSQLSLEGYWQSTRGLISCNGYQIRPQQKQNDASHLHGLRDLNDSGLFRFLVDPKVLDFFARATLAWPREREIYSAPLVLVKVSPGPNRANGRAVLALSDVAYTESFYGYSAGSKIDGNLAVRFLQLFVHSDVWTHYALLTSPEFGAERRKLQKADLDRCPYIPTEDLTDKQRKTILKLSERLIKEDATVFHEIDLFFGELYGLGKDDLEVIRDTLAVELPFEEARKKACSVPDKNEQGIFSRRLESLLRPFFKTLGKEPQVSVWRSGDAREALLAPFGVVLLGETGRAVAKPDELYYKSILPFANETGATRIVQQIDGGLLIGILNQYRYWTPSRARLLAADILREHMQVFEE